jgi:uncharacterized protein YyaL (SSP411 family)
LACSPSALAASWLGVGVDKLASVRLARTIKDLHPADMAISHVRRFSLAPIPGFGLALLIGDWMGRTVGMNHLTSPVQDSKLSTNRLANETSPYLLQHQHNPVDWYPWGAEAFERARRENKPIFLSVGYSTCYWCHVMERQCFESEAVAAVMNEKFVNIKVDREERPDVDQLYMTAVQVLTRQGGWPMSVWLTPDLKPFYGGTYFPPTDQHGRPGFVTLLHALADAYYNRRADVDQTSGQIVNILQQVAKPGAPERPITIDEAFVDELIARSTSDYDSVHGGFGAAPKFPRETLLELLLVYLRDVPGTPPASHPKSRVNRMVYHTLDALAAGGIRDHLGGGFHRYSTDAEWLVPHFEIMLYDQAMLAWCYAEAFGQTGRPNYAAVARGVFDFVLREMTSPDGAFYTAMDAEVDGQEGLNYLWTPEEVEPILGPDDAAYFNKSYGLDAGPNFADPHHGTGTPDKNILFLPDPIDEVIDARLTPMRAKLKAVRDQRKQPLLDTKILTSWNAMMIRALTRGGAVLAEPRYTAAAQKALRFIFQNHLKPDGGLYRTSRNGRKQYDAFLDDYACIIAAWLELGREADDGREIVRLMSERFGDPDAGGFYFTDDRSSDLIVRQKTATDSPLPSGNGVAAMSLVQLGELDMARATIAAFAGQLKQNCEGMSAMVQAVLMYLRAGGEPFTVSADRGAQPRPASPLETARDVVHAEARWANPTELHVNLRIDPRFHINAHDLGGQAASLIATRISIENAAAKIEYPPGETMKPAFADLEMRVYHDDVTIICRFEEPPAANLSLSITYQACDDQACLPPITKRLDVSAILAE